MGTLKQIDEKQLRDMISQHKSGNEIAKLLDISKRTLYNKLHKLGLTSVRMSHIDESIFDIIDSEEKAYWLGFLYADGYISINHFQVELSLSAIDIEHIRKFKHFLKDDRDDTIIKTSMVGNGKYTRARYCVGSKQLHEQLISLGCLPRKSLILTFPDIGIFKERELVFHFIRGYLDGDGCIYSNNKRMAIEILGTESFLNSIREYFPEFSIPKKDKRNNVFRICCSHRNADYVGRKLYLTATIYLERKFLKFATLVKPLTSETSGNIGEICDDNTEITNEIAKGSLES